MMTLLFLCYYAIWAVLLICAAFLHFRGRLKEDHSERCRHTWRTIDTYRQDPAAGILNTGYGIRPVWRYDVTTKRRCMHCGQVSLYRFAEFKSRKVLF